MPELRGLELSEGSLTQMVGEWYREEYGWDAAVLAFNVWLAQQRVEAAADALQSVLGHLREAQDDLPADTLEELHTLRGYLLARGRASDYAATLLTGYNTLRDDLEKALKELPNDTE